MSERLTRFISGLCIICFLLLEWSYGIWGVVTLLLLEGATNWRFPTLVSGFHYAMDGPVFDFEENK